jgi:hypothetical protein
MANLTYNASIRQGYNFEKDAQITVAHINSIKIGDTAMSSDIGVTNPEDVSASVKVFGVGSAVSWEGGYADAIYLGAQVSTDNKNKLSTLVHKSMSNTEVEVEFTVYQFDPIAKKYYKAFHCNGVKLKGLIHKSGGQLNMAIDSEAGHEVASPLNYSFQVGVMPQATAQEIHLAVSSTDKLVKAWGVTIAA